MRIQDLVDFKNQNTNGAVNDFKSCSDSANIKRSKDGKFKSSSPKAGHETLYHRRSLAGNFLFGAETARRHWTLAEALDGGLEFRRIGVQPRIDRARRQHDQKALDQALKDSIHPADEQQSIQDGYWWAKHGGHAP